MTNLTHALSHTRTLSHCHCAQSCARRDVKAHSVRVHESAIAHTLLDPSQKRRESASAYSAGVVSWVEAMLKHAV